MNHKRGYLPTIYIMLIMLSLSSCKLIFDDYDNCGYVNIKFEYSYNVLSTNALDSQVDQVMLYVFDSDNKLVYKKEGKDIEAANNYMVQINELKAGKYKFVAWAQNNDYKDDASYFKIDDLAVNVATLADLTYYLKRTDGTQNKKLNNLLVGYSDVEISNATDIQHVMVPLKKVNKGIRVVLLPYRGASALDVNDYTFRIVDEIGNGHINYDYSIIDDSAIEYYPYYSENVLPNSSETTTPNEIDRAAIVEFNSSRLMEAHKPKLIISSKEDGNIIANINLPWILSLANMESKNKWSVQEYLDREDRHSLTLFIDNNDTWMQSTIIINGWVINTPIVDL